MLQQDLVVLRRGAEAVLDADELHRRVPDAPQGLDHRRPQPADDIRLLGDDDGPHAAAWAMTASRSSGLMVLTLRTRTEIPSLAKRLGRFQRLGHHHAAGKHRGVGAFAELPHLPDVVRLVRPG